MIPPRRAATSAEPALVTGLLGAAAVLAAVRALLAELAEDGDHCPPGAEPARSTTFDEVVDAVLGLAALARTAARALPTDPVVPADAGAGAAPPAAGSPAAPIARELLR
jgi:hypothetical protein